MLKTLLSLHSFASLVLSTALPTSMDRSVGEPKSIWRPQAGLKFQIILDAQFGRSRNTELLSSDADIIDIDLFDSTPELIQKLHSRGKRVICYMNAGSSETWRPDYASIKATDKGDVMKEWRKEQWLDIRSPDVFGVMRKRIQMASAKGCDGIDPDNVDAYGDESGRAGGFASKLTKQDSIDYIRKLANEASQYGLAIGLKNAEAILPSVQNVIQYAVNEQCAGMYGGCSQYTSFINQNRPVFHIEYAQYKVNGTVVQLTAEDGALSGLSTAELQKVYCLESGLGARRMIDKEVGRKFSTVIKTMDLNKAVMYCDGTTFGMDGAPKQS